MQRPTRFNNLARTLLVVGLLVGVAVPPPVTAAACESIAPQPESKRKFHPGHYVTIGRGEMKKGRQRH